MGERGGDFCFCTLALGEFYRALAVKLAGDLARHSPGSTLYVFTDGTAQFSGLVNVAAIRHRQRGLFHCYHDKRLVLAHGLRFHRAAIFLDADTRITGAVPSDLDISPGLESLQFWPIFNLPRPSGPSRRLDAILAMCGKFDLRAEQVSFVQESIFSVARDEGRELEFLELWGRMSWYWEFRAMHIGEGDAIGLAAAAVGWEVRPRELLRLLPLRSHALVSMNDENLVREKQRRRGMSRLRKLRDPASLRKRAHYTLRLILARCASLRRFSFYYR